ncbi:hypothetical protein [Streptomyces sp. NPDC003832]
MGRAQDCLGRYEEALAEYGQALRELTERPVSAHQGDAARARIFVYSAHALGLLGRHEEALEQAEAALATTTARETPSLTCRLHLARGLALARLGDHRAARAELTRVIELTEEVPLYTRALSDEATEILASLDG